MEKFSASQSTKFMNCHASANLELAIPHWVPPEEDPNANNAANRGSLMHEMFAGVMSLSAKDGRMMAEAIAYVTAIRARRRFKVLIEATAAASWLKQAPNTQADLVLYTQDELHIFDLKTGAIPVSAVENYQLMYYAVTYGPLAPKATGVHLHIVQPWADNIDVWFADTARLDAFMTEARAVEAEILNGIVTFSPGDHGQFCPANPRGRGARGHPFCPALMKLYYPQPEPDYAEMMKED